MRDDDHEASTADIAAVANLYNLGTQLGTRYTGQIALVWHLQDAKEAHDDRFGLVFVEGPMHDHDQAPVLIIHNSQQLLHSCQRSVGAREGGYPAKTNKVCDKYMY